MTWRHSLAPLLAAALATMCLAAPPSGDRKPSSKKGSSQPRAKSSKTDEEGAADAADSAATPQPAAGQIVIRRQPLHLRAPEKYQISMHLEPKQMVRVASPFDGTVKSLLRKPGQKIETATEIVRMDVTAKQLLLDRAKALYRAAQLEAEQAGGGKGVAEGPGASTAPIGRQLADARLAAAQAEPRLASFSAVPGGP